MQLRRSTLAVLILPLLLLASVAGFAATAAKANPHAGPVVATTEPDLCLRALPFPWASQIITNEELLACGLYPQETRLECIIDIKEQGCYATTVDGFGAFEHVLFCVDWNADSNFSPAEVVGEVSVHIHDESNSQTGPWKYAVYRDFTPPGGPRTDLGNTTTTTVSIGPTYHARAILSYDAAPSGCDYVPVWGNVLDFDIRLDPIR
jgi:hypothetical protein